MTFEKLFLRGRIKRMLRDLKDGTNILQLNKWWFQSLGKYILPDVSCWRYKEKGNPFWGVLGLKTYESSKCECLKSFTSSFPTEHLQKSFKLRMLTIKICIFLLHLLLKLMPQTLRDVIDGVPTWVRKGWNIKYLNSHRFNLNIGIILATKVNLK